MNLPKTRNELAKDKKCTPQSRISTLGLPKAFASYFKYAQTMGFDDQPDYSYLLKSFRNPFVRNGFEYDHVFDLDHQRGHLITNSCSMVLRSFRFIVSPSIIP